MENTFKSVIKIRRLPNKQLNMLWVSVSNEDFLYDQAATFMNYLTSKNIKYKSLVTGIS